MTGRYKLTQIRPMLVLEYRKIPHTRSTKWEWLDIIAIWDLMTIEVGMVALEHPLQ